MSNNKNNTKYQAADFLKADFMKTDFMKTDFMKNYPALAQKSWEAMLGQLQNPRCKDDFINVLFPANSTASVTLEHALSGLKSYAEWMHGAAASVGSPGADWGQQLEQLFGQGRQPFAQAFTGMEPGAAAGVHGFSQQWQAWMQSLQNNASSTASPQGPFATFGVDHEQQAEQQRLMAAFAEQLEAANRYQQLIQRSNERAMDKMRARLAPLAKPTAQIESLKKLYDVWVECAEEAYAEIARSDEFSEAYAAMVNTQMRVRHLQQAQIEKICRQMGIPTRSDVDNLGERLHDLRREIRGGSSAAPNAQADEVSQLRREVAELRALISGREGPVPVSKKHASTSAAASSPVKTSAVKKAVLKEVAGAQKSARQRNEASPEKPTGKTSRSASTRKKK